MPGISKDEIISLKDVFRILNDQKQPEEEFLNELFSGEITVIKDRSIVDEEWAKHHPLVHVQKAGKHKRPEVAKRIIWDDSELKSQTKIENASDINEMEQAPVEESLPPEIALAFESQSVERGTMEEGGRKEEANKDSNTISGEEIQPL